jgi:hypothetical protein
MTAREIEEYRALRDTIRERSTLRIWMVLAGLTVWGTLTIATGSLAELPISSLLPLLILSATFEIVFGLHTAVERVGRYIQVFFENDVTDRGWEHQAMAYGRQFPGSGPDPLFAVYFWAATVLNIVPAAMARPAPVEWAVVGALHALVIGRIALARRQAGQQRAQDLQRFQRLKQTGSSHPADG